MSGGQDKSSGYLQIVWRRENGAMAWTDAAATCLKRVEDKSVESKEERKRENVI